jgi:hypothetical protein
VVIGAVFCNVTRELGHFDLCLELPLEASKEDLSLTGLEAIADAWDRPHAVCHREEDQLLVDEVHVPQSVDVVVHKRGHWVVCLEPLLAVVGLRLAKGESDDFLVVHVDVLEVDLVLTDGREVLLGFL